MSRTRVTAVVAAMASAITVSVGAGRAAAQLPVLPSLGSSLKKGDELDLRSCTYGPEDTHAGRESGQYFVDRNAFYAVVYLPTDLPGGHFRIRGIYPRARWFSFESYDEALASEGVVADDTIDPDRGSVNPFLPGRRFARKKHRRYTVDIRTVAPADRQSPPPHNVLYMGWRENPHYGLPSLESPILYRVYAAPGSPRGNVPLPDFRWVVDDPKANLFQTSSEVCATLAAAGAPHQAVTTLNQILDRRVTSPWLSPAERSIDVPTDDIPHDPPYVSVIRPASNGYQGLYFNSKTPYIYLRPSAVFGRFLVIRFRAPTFGHVEGGRPLSGDEQTRYWSWCAGQFVSPVNVTQACLMDKQFHIDRRGYATLVVSPPDQRPVVGGKPYPDWLPWPGGGADLNMREIDPNPRTFPQSPYFIPLLSPDDALDYLKAPIFESEIESWMGSYFPQVQYCSSVKFERNGCGTRAVSRSVSPSPSAG